MVATNRFSQACSTCGDDVAAGAGLLYVRKGLHHVRHPGCEAISLRSDTPPGRRTTPPRAVTAPVGPAHAPPPRLWVLWLPVLLGIGIGLLAFYTGPVFDEVTRLTATCRDGSISLSDTRQGTCSHHGGVRTWGGTLVTSERGGPGFRGWLADHATEVGVATAAATLVGVLIVWSREESDAAPP